MKQNIYDNSDFYESYVHMRKTSTGLNDILEIPAFRALLPDVKGKTLLDLGCGYGEADQWYIAQGAAHVTGVDISENMITLAKKNQVQAQEQLHFLQVPIEDMHFQDEQFDIVVSSLAFHYIEHIETVFEKIYSSLKPGGYLIFSQEHPVATAAPDGWITDENGEKQYWALDNYLDEGMRRQHWFIDGVIKYHRTVSTLINALIDTGFTIHKISEPAVIQEVEQRQPALKSERKRPPFMMIKACKQQG